MEEDPKSQFVIRPNFSISDYDPNFRLRPWAQFINPSSDLDPILKLLYWLTLDLDPILKKLYSAYT